MARKTLVMGFSLVLFLVASESQAYQTIQVVDGATIEGRVAFTGNPPLPRTFKVKKDPEVCGTERILKKVEVQNGLLKGVVIVLEGVKSGKSYEAQSYKGTSPDNGEFRYSAGKTLDLDIRLKNCNFGPLTGVVAMGQPIQYLNQDPMKHTLHTYSVKGQSANILRTATSQHLPAHTQIDQTFTTKNLKKGRFVAITCDRHNFMENWMYVVHSPYFAISDQDGSFAIDQIPHGNYKLVAWHPVLGMQEQAVRVMAGGKMRMDFEFSK